MEGKTKEEPAVSVVLIQVYPDTFKIVWSQRPTGLILCIRSQFVNDALSVRLEIIQQDVHSEFHTLGGLFQCVDQRGQGVAFLFAPGKLNQEFGNNICAVIQEIVFLKCAVTGCFDS